MKQPNFEALICAFLASYQCVPCTSCLRKKMDLHIAKVQYDLQWPFFLDVTVLHGKAEPKNRK